MSGYFTEILEQVRKDNPEIAEAMEVFKEADLQYKNTLEAMNFVNPIVITEAVSKTNRWDKDGYISTTAK